MQTWTIQKPSVSSRHGVVSAQNLYAAQAGARVLERGGNAMDAAIVTALVLSVVEPWLSGIGGGGFLLHKQASTGEVSALDFGVHSSNQLDPENYPLVGGNDGEWFSWPAVKEDRNLIGYSSICVPGTIDGFAKALEKYGTLSWAEALQPAIEQADKGLELDWYACFCLAIEAASLARFPKTAEIFLDNGKAPRTSERQPHNYAAMPDKARVLRRLATVGARDFYEGEIADSLVRDLNAGGSSINHADLKSYHAQWVKPLQTTYRDWNIHAIPGLSGGPSFVEAMADIERDLQIAAHSEPVSDEKAALIYARAIRSSYERRLKTMGHAGTPDGDCTSHLSVIDRDGNVVTLTNTLLSRFGSKVVLPETGFLMNNGMMWFDPRKDKPNSITAGVKPLANMCPLLLDKKDGAALAIGAAGGRQIFPALAQLLSYMIDFDMEPAQAFHYPRIDASAPMIKVDNRAAAPVAASLAAEFPVEIIENTLYPVNFAIPSAVLRNADGLITGQAHPFTPWAQAVAADKSDGDKNG